MPYDLMNDDYAIAQNLRRNRMIATGNAAIVLALIIVLAALFYALT